MGVAKCLLCFQLGLKGKAQSSKLKTAEIVLSARLCNRALTLFSPKYCLHYMGSYVAEKRHVD